MNQNEQVDMSLIGVDKASTVQAYYNRDVFLQVNHTTQIVDSLKKLGYYNLAERAVHELQTFKIKKLIYLVSTSLRTNYNDGIRERTIDELLYSIEELNDFVIFQNELNVKVERSEALKLHVNLIDVNILNFYDDLTLEELNILGY